VTPAPDPTRILVVDDAPDTLEVIQRMLAPLGCQVITATAVAQAVQLLAQEPVDLVVTDLRMPKVGGLDLVRHVRENCADTEVIVITGYASVGSAVESMKAGAEEYVPKPFTDAELSAAVARALNTLHRRRAARRPAGDPAGAAVGLIGASLAMRDVVRTIAKAARTSATVLIAGESGTGKEVVARAIHYQSRRANAPFVPVNCGGIPEGLLESELFGHIKGAFTGATESRAGFFQSADGGSIFLDEVGDTSLAMQARLLRVLEDKHVHMVGSTRSHAVDVRILAATNRDLRALAAKGLFREDLFFRLNVIALALPPLRDRGDDVLLLARHFSDRYAREVGRTAPQFTDRALRVLLDYHWPGNVRELQNVIQRLMVMTEGDTIDVRDLPSLMRFAAGRGKTPLRTLAAVEAEHIRAVLAGVDGNKTRAAHILGIDRKTLRTKMRTAPPSDD
jgi:two-component system response regulator HydG